MSWAAFGGATLDFLKKVPGWIWLGLAGLVIGFAYVQREKAKAVERNNDKRDKEAAEVEAEVLTNITENTDAVIREADTVRSAPAVVELPDGTKALPDYHYRD